MPFSYLSHLECPRCHIRWEADRVQQLCSCGSPLLARYDLAGLKQSAPTPALTDRPPTLWRYHELLPVRDPERVISLGEGMTPLLPVRRLGAALGIGRLLVKDEGLLPSGTFKARGAAVGVSRAHELGITRIAMPTNGNAGAAWAWYAARAGMASLIVMPVDAPAITRAECVAAGARLYLVSGLISDAGRIVAGAVARQGWFDASTLKEPYRIEGKKTMGLEIVEQLGWRVPDVIMYPTGGGVGIIGIYKGLQELMELGWIPRRWPRLVAVQAEGCAPIVRAYEERAMESRFWQGAATVAFGINVPKALGDFLVLQALYHTEGCAVAVSDDELLTAQRLAAQKEGLWLCPEGAATVAAAARLRSQGWIGESDEVVLLNTGTGLKYPDTIEVRAPVLQPNEEIAE